ncbi:MAG: hypothetical protein LBD45_04085, partial [Bacteroidales bacterium]|nr:hypothetical protein [Bacteroidales bacterium]
AAICFDKGVEVAPEYPFAYIGQGLVALKTDKKAAENLFSKATKLDKKSARIQVDIAMAYAKNDLYDEANTQIEKARKIDKKNPYIYVAEGNIIMQKNDPSKAGEAASKYDNAIYFDPNCKVAYIKGAKIYRVINIGLSLELLQKVLALDSEYTPAYLELGETYYANKLYSKSVEAYKHYVEAPGVTEEYFNKYASVLVVAKDFPQVLIQANQALAKNPKNAHMLRLKMYSQYELEDFSGALETARQFFNTAKTEELAWQDYRYYALILKENKLTSEAIVALNKAEETVTDQPEIYKELIAAYEAQNDFKNVIPNYRKYFAIAPEYSLSDLLSYGRAYYWYAVSIPEAEPNAPKTPELLAAEKEKTDNIGKADSLFTEVTNKAPQLFQGYWWRARANSLLDPTSQQGLAKPYYEQTLQKMEEAGSTAASVLIEANKYLAYYYYLKFVEADAAKQKTDVAENKAKSIPYWEKVLELDPADEGAIAALKVLKK